MLIGLRKIVHGTSLVRFQLEPVGQETLYVQFVSLVKIGCVLVVGVLGDIEFIGQKRANPSELQDTLAAVHDSQLVLAHQLLAQFLIVEGMGNLPPTALPGVHDINRFFPQCCRQFLQGGRLFAAQEDGGIHIADDGIRIVLVDRLELGLGLQHKAGGNLTGADGGNQLFQLGNLPNVGALVNEAAHMDREPAAVHIICLFTQQVEQLGVAQGNEKIEGIIRVAHNEKQCRFQISQRVQLQLVIGGQVTQLLNVEGSQPCAAGN